MFASALPCTDECGVSLGTHSRDKAWARKGRRTDRIPRALGAPRISVLPAVCLDGMLAVMAQEGIMVRLDIEYFLEEVLVCAPFMLFYSYSLGADGRSSDGRCHR